MKVWVGAGACLAAAAVIWLVAFASGEDASSPNDVGAEASSEEPAVHSADPNRFARRTIPPAELRAYIRVSQELGVDWAILAAAGRVDRGAARLPARERALGTGYALRGLGAPEDYRIALEQHLGSAAASANALALAERLRALEAAPPPVNGPLELPVDGDVLAAYGQQYGLLHDGVDIAAATGEEIRAAAGGVVLSVGFSGTYGEYTCVLHRFRPALDGERELTTCYGNQSAYEAKAGDRVQAGDVIGRVGCTGPCLRPHLHFQVRRGRSPVAPTVDPERFLAPGTEIEAGRPLEAG